MKLYLDENFPPVVLEPLRAIYSVHEFRSWVDEALGSTLDLDLFPALASRGFDAIITRDRRQLKNPTERRAVSASGLIWIGMADKRFGGIEMLSTTASSLIAGLRFVLDDSPITPTWYELRHIPHQRDQRIKSGPL